MQVGPGNKWLTAAVTWLAVTAGLSDLACLSGCIVPENVKEAFGFTDAGVEVVYSPWLGGAVKVGSKFAGEGEADYDPKTGTFSFRVKVASDPTGVIAAQGDRIGENFLEARRIEWAGKEAVYRAIGDNISKGINAVMQGAALVATGAGAQAPLVGEAGVQLINAGGAILQGVASQLNTADDTGSVEPP